MDIERSFVNLFINPEAMIKVWDDGVRKIHFADPSMAEIFEWSMNYFTESRFKFCPTKEVLEHQFPAIRNWWSDEEILPGYLISELLKRYKVRTVRDKILALAPLVEAEPDRAISTGLSDFVSVQQDTVPRNRVTSYGQGFSNRIDHYMENVLGKVKIRGIPTPWDALTDHTNGIEKSEVGVLIGSPNSGKSWILASFALAAAQSGVKTYYASLENGRQMTDERLDCIMSGIPFFRYHAGLLTPAETSRLRDTQEKIEALGDFLRVDTPSKRADRTVADIYTAAKYWGADIVVGDQLSWITPVSNFAASASESLAMGEVISDIMVVSREMQIASLWGAQFNRDARKGGGGKLHNIGLSHKIEENVDFAFSIWAGEQQKASEALIFEILKGRRFPHGKWVLDFQLQNKTKIGMVREYSDEN